MTTLIQNYSKGKFRDCDFQCGGEAADGCVFYLDFNIDPFSKGIYLVRASFDRNGCLSQKFPIFNQEESKILMEWFTNDSNEEKANEIIKKYLHQNFPKNWQDCLDDFSL